MLACAATNIVCVTLLLLVLIFSGNVRYDRSKPAPKDVFAPLVSALDLGVSYTRGVAELGASVSSLRVTTSGTYNRRTASASGNLEGSEIYGPEVAIGAIGGGAIGAIGASGQRGTIVPASTSLPSSTSMPSSTGFYTAVPARALGPVCARSDGTHEVYDTGTTATAAMDAASPWPAGLEKFTSIVRAVAGISRMQTENMCNSGNIEAAVVGLKRGLSGKSCRGVVDAMQSMSVVESDLTRQAIATLALAIADATCVNGVIDPALLSAALDGVKQALCSRVASVAGVAGVAGGPGFSGFWTAGLAGLSALSGSSSSCTGILVTPKAPSPFAPTNNAQSAQAYAGVVRALAAAVRAFAIERSRCKEAIVRVRGMNQELADIAALVRNKDITIGCARIKAAMEAQGFTAQGAAALTSLIRSALVSVACTESSALAALTTEDLRGLIISTIQAACT